MSLFLICDVQSNGGDKQQSEGEASQPAEDTIKKHCPKKEKQFFDRKNNVWVKFDLETEFEANQKVLFVNEGSGAVVKELCYPLTANIENRPEDNAVIDPGSWPVRVAVKKIKIRRFELIEIVVLENVSDGKCGLIYYGCHLSDDGNNVYLVQENLVGDFFQGNVQETFIALQPKERLWFYRQLFEQVIKLNDNKFVHNDIKLDNMMFDSTQTRFVIFDFGLAQQKDTPLSSFGSEHYASPGKYRNIGGEIKASLIDDLYSLAITIGIIEGGEERVTSGTDLKDFGKKEIHFHSCYFDRIRINVEKILQSRRFALCVDDFEKVKGKSIDQLTFINLISLILEYLHFKLTGVEVMQIINRELGDMQHKTRILDFTPIKSELVCPGDPKHQPLI